MKHLTLLILLWVVSCCISKQETAEERDVVFTRLETTSFFGLPIQMYLSDTLLFVNDFYGDTLVHCFNLTNFKEVTKVGVVGDGPNEVMRPVHLFTKNNQMYLLSRPTWTLYTCSLDSIASGTLKRNIVVNPESSLVFPLTDSTYLCSGMFPENRFEVINAMGAKLYSFDFYPSYWTGESDFPIEVKRMFHQVRGYVRLPGNRFAVATSHVLGYYELIGDKIEKVKEICLSPYEYNDLFKGVSSQADLKPEYKKGVKCMSVSDDFIYLLFDPSVGKDKEMKEIWVFDHDGNQVYTLHPNINIATFAVDTANRIIATSDEENPQLILFDGEL